jgi:hypothetical protein
VPADRLAAATAELAPVFLALADAVRGADEERHRAADEARRLVAGAEDLAKAILERAQLDWDAVRAAEEARLRSEATDGPEPAPRIAGKTPTELAGRVVAQVRLDVARLASAWRPPDDR